MDKRTLILSAAEKLFGEKGFEGTTVRDIAHSAGVNLAMISYYFGSKEKLFEALVEYRSGYTTGVLEELAQDEHLEPMQKMYKLIDFYVERILSNFQFHNIISRQFSTLQSTDLKEALMRMKAKNLEQIEKIMADGQKKGVFRKVDLELTLASIIGTISQLTLSKEWYCRILGILSPDPNDFSPELVTRLKNHLKDMVTAHLRVPQS
ncbi:TetR/AcrR family transcriptional regulator [Dinghuibacter silviterrae]|uniref:TetR family transcriptional regulator n=1 Tax=Dinghuibacter silviterrae TaxID=1539049 RepID=A0A4R8DNK0_9BACT|nr:TetR family transcriptional regulator [Dinghuibacter silviterrae]TDW99388.1 TetR family transcriptional regulator [Dinghuibacter silviterrae]